MIKTEVKQPSNLITISKLGDIWLLGQHRIMCGDSTDIEQVKKLTNQEKADLAFTDPPYNVKYTGRRLKRENITNDQLSEKEFRHFLDKCIVAYQFALKRGASFYICYGTNSHIAVQQALEQHDFEIRNQIIWAKNHFVISFARYKMKHETILYCHRKEERDAWYGDKKQTTLWEFPKPQKNSLHPTMKPVSLIEKVLMNSSKKDDIVIDLFGGSGSTLIACENQGRCARLMEIEPHYVDVTIQRWQELTRQKAVLAQTGIAFNQLVTQKINS